MSTDKKHVRCLKTDDLDLWHRVAATMNALHHTAGVVVLSRLMNFGPGEPALIVQLNGQCPYWTRWDDETADQFRQRAATQALALAGEFGTTPTGPHGLVEFPQAFMAVVDALPADRPGTDTAVTKQ
ncbi:MAG: hypothetical protein QM750_11910 [Rubrivivax sp.]